MGRIRIGVDYPYRTFEWTAEMLAQDGLFNARELRAIFYDNAAQIVAREGRA